MRVITYESIQSSVRQITGQCDCDCACDSSIKYINDNLTVNEVPLIVDLGPSGHSLWHIALDPLTGNIAVIDRDVLRLLEAVGTSSQARNAPSSSWQLRNVLSSQSFSVPDNTWLNSSPGIMPGLVAWLHLTGNCNLRCSYCYLAHRNTTMSKETGYAVVDASFRSALNRGWSSVKLKYTGGEPLLCFPLVVDLQRYAQTQASRYNINLDSVVLSNGTLLNPEIITTMQDLDLRLMISLDGLGEWHNSQRHYINGHGSSVDVQYAIDLALAYGLVPDISITVSGSNIQGLPQLMEWILERDLPFSINFYRENDKVVSRTALKLEEEKIIRGMLAAYKVIEQHLPRRSLLASLVDRANFAFPHLRPCSVGQGYLVFDTQGQVSKCQMQMDNPVTDSSASDPLAVVRAAESGIQNLSVDEKEECRACRWRYWCGGGCPLLTYRATGRYDVKSPNCNIYKALYPEVIRLEGLRLLKYTQRDGVL
ncbi:MAG: radical SAM protein [Anaerolineae bacterium]|nr:radical SAM protein [Anaerolineae bacterium]